MDKQDKYRGKIAEIKLSKSIVFNGKEITHAVIEIDHINYGLNKKTKKLNSKKRTNFTVKQIEKFIFLLDEEEQAPIEYKGLKSRFAIRIDCPIKGKFFGKEFLMIFETHYKKDHEIYTITLIPAW